MNPRTDETPGGGPGDSGDRQGSGSSASVPPTGDNSPYQLLPELTPTEYAALRDSIAAEGIRVPVQVDEDGVILDGHHRARIADELGIDCPTVTVSNLDTETAKRTVALGLNLSRRHLNREQTRQVIAASLEADPHLSDREQARRLGVSPTTVGTVRKQLEVSTTVDTAPTGAPDREEIERAIAHVDMWIANLRSYIDVGCRLLIETGMPEAAAGALADRVWDDMSTAILNPADDNAADLFNARSGSFFELVQTMVDTAGDRP